METMKLNYNKLKELVHYICDKAAADPSCLGSIKLNKVLWYSDAYSYLKTGKSITGETYVKRQHGPVPKHIPAIVETLVKEGKIARGKVEHFGFMKHEYISLDDPDFDTFTAREIVIVNAAFQHVCINHTARSVSAETHDLIWSLAEMGEEIPLATVFATSVSELDESDIEWAEDRLREAA